MTYAPHPLLTALAQTRDDETFARLLRDGGRALLRDPVGIGPVALAALGETGDLAQAAARLLATALDEARMAEENDLPEGSALLSTLAAAVAAHEAKTPLSAAQRLALARAFASAGLVPPPFARLTADSVTDHLPDGAVMPDLGEILDPILRDAGDSPGQAHAALSELLAGLPPELAAMLVSMTVDRPGAVEARLGLYWLLDPQADIRLAAATALVSRTNLPPDLAALLPTLRKWMPDDPARAAVDAVIRRQMRAGTQPSALAVKVHRAAASLPDGVGAQSLIAAVQIGSRRAVAMAMLKQGHGVKDAFLIPCGSATEQKTLLARVLDEIDSIDLPPAALAAILAWGLGEGLALGRPPAPGMVDMAEVWGAEALSPKPFGTADVLAALGPTPGPADDSALIAASATWADRFSHLDSWFEDTGPLREALARARTDAGREAAVWKHLATRREAWARTIAASAAVLQAGQDPIWPSFAAVARALIGDRTLKRIPILHDIVAMTLEAWAAGEGAAPEEAPDGGETLLAEAGLGDAFLDGYLTALCIAPVAPAPEVWLGTLLGRIEFPGEGSINRVMAALSARVDRIEETAPDPVATAAHLSPLSPDGLQDWCAGFHALVTVAPRAFPARSLGPDDKRLLRTLSQVAEGRTDPTLAAVLPAWISQRHARRK
ncbi:UPF0149 family protein [Gemmatimonas sp.]|uniref:UPF0149 family protein n=1 Tax=Gemmatimonas sp. TaxID=1962908 RepID=UPI0025C56A87|nr:UPF0149 family protein [Gemmatimonas sp.]MCA2991089.1 UPF0149 family protein [Gemmatimonas sp.]